MIDSDKKQFSALVTGTAEIHGKAISKDGLRLWWAALEEHSIDEVRQAFTQHAKDPDRGSWMPKPADIIRQIEGETPTPDQIIAAAMHPRTALALLCRQHIGTWNLDHWTSLQLRPLAESCIALIPEWKARINAGKLTDHERGLLQKYGIDNRSARLSVAQISTKQTEIENGT